MALDKDTPVQVVEDMFCDFPVLASTVIYEGAMVGLSSGYARGLVAGDVFVGHAYQAVTGGTASGDKRVKVRAGRYCLKVSIYDTIAVTNVNDLVYASADGTITTTAGSNSPCGRIRQYIDANTAEVEFFPAGAVGMIADHNHTAGTTDGGKLTSPLVVTGLKDTNGNSLLAITATTSADNRIRLANQKGASSPTLSAYGTSTNIGVGLYGKGTGIVQIGGGAAQVVKLGTASTTKVGFFNATAVSRIAHIASLAASYTSASIRIQVLAILNALRTIGILKTS